MPDKLILELHASPALAAALAALHVGAGIIASLLPVGLPGRFALLALSAAGLYRALRLHGLRRSPDAVVAFSLAGDDDCAVRRRESNTWEEGRLTDRWVHPRLTLLVVRRRGRRLPVSVVIPADGVSAEAFRRLRVRLRLQTAAD